MQIDLHTLWYLTIGTLLVSTAILLWERQAHPRRARALGIWAGGLLVFALGCVVAMSRDRFPGASGMALTNVLMVSGYLMVFQGAAGLDGRGRPGWSVAAVGALILLWTIVGVHFPLAFWHHVAAVPIALTCGLTAWTLLRSDTIRTLRSRPIAVAISAGHGVFYAARAVLTPILADLYGGDLLMNVAKATMFEAVLYAVAMPMTFLALVREEGQTQLLAQSRTDYLTGLANRHGFFEQGARIFAAARPGDRIALLAFDLDHFKAINDDHGHAVGDEVLKLFAEVAKTTVGPDVVLVRLGGEEFAALLPGQGLQSARRTGAEIARRFADAARSADGLGIRATVSIGLAHAEAGRRDLAALLAEADRALYQAKSLGRDRLEVAAPHKIAAAA